MEKGQTKENQNNNGAQAEVPGFGAAQGLSVLLIGMGIGWLAGLTIAPVASSILTSILGLASGVVVGLQTIKPWKGASGEKNSSYLDARPAALLIVGIAFATPAGIMARTHALFEPRSRETAGITPADEEEVLDMGQSTGPKSKVRQGVLFSNYKESCDIILGEAVAENYPSFLGELSASEEIPQAKEMVERYKDDPETLAYFLDIICQYYQPK
ncbi:MAG: hypothetical protein KDD06_29650 [Phaeodactylibacter sp.]|nr:hypothetical protein [Phaeodactylibacter sp.]MCB9288669.1 hypothetical protein [Lewinellaceae bacterium]